MQTIYLDHANLPPEVVTAKQRTFPGYTGHKYQVCIRETIDVRSYWSGGSKDTFRFCTINGKESIDIPTQSAFDPTLPGAESVQLIPGLICVEHSIFLGKDAGLTFHVCAGPKWLPTPETLTDVETLVLEITSSLKSFARQSEREQRGISQEAWDTASIALKDRKLLRKNGSITPSGRNAVSVGSKS